ncbi:MAG: carbonic anhydrase [Humidesulfovibrio sp.]
MKRRLCAALVVALGLFVSAPAVPAESAAGPGMAGDEALKLLKDGNARYAAGQSTHPNAGGERRAATAKNTPQPLAAILGCSDARVPLELVFDQGLGDIFAVRVAGNVAGPDELASVEYAVAQLDTPVLLVLGHTECGAVKAAAQNAKVQGSLPFLLNQIRPAVAKARAWSPTASGDELLDKAIKANVWLVMENIIRKSAEVRKRVQQGRLLLVGGVYDLHSGQVNWLGAHPDQGKILVSASKRPAAPKPRPAPAPVQGEAPARSDTVDQGSMIDLPPDAPAAASPAPAHQ